MKLEGPTPMLRTRDLEASVEFSTSRLGFRCGQLREDDNDGYLLPIGQKIARDGGDGT